MAHVLLVEPPSPAREQLIKLLTDSGHRAQLSQNGADALVRLGQGGVDLVLVDEGALLVNGFELADRVRRDHGFIPVVIILARSGSEPRARALAAANDAVTRPYDAVELHARCVALLRTKRLVEELRATRAEIESRSLADQTTGLRNRVFLNERLEEEWKRAARYSEPLSLVLLAVAGMTRGQAFTDRTLLAVAQGVTRALRQIDLVARFGPFELAALLPKTHVTGALICAERIYRDLGALAIDDVRPVVSMGLAFFPSKEVGDPSDLVRLAARALERAREQGPGSICLVQHQGYLFAPKRL